MANRPSIHRELTLSLNAQLGPQGLQKALAEFSRDALRDYVRTQNPPPIWATFVNGHQGLDEGQVKLPGAIVYQFNWLRVIAAETLDWLRRESPVRKGDYAKAHFVMWHGGAVQPSAIPSTATEIIVTNDQPYARKIHVGAIKTSAPPFIFEEARQMILSRFGHLVEAQVRFIDLSGAYKLKRGRNKGKMMTYPAVVITDKAA